MGKKEKLTQLSCLMEKLYNIDNQLGGTAKKRKKILLLNKREREKSGIKVFVNVFQFDIYL